MGVTVIAYTMITHCPGKTSGLDRSKNLYRGGSRQDRACTKRWHLQFGCRRSSSLKKLRRERRGCRRADHAGARREYLDSRGARVAGALPAAQVRRAGGVSSTGYRLPGGTLWPGWCKRSNPKPTLALKPSHGSESTAGTKMIGRSWHRRSCWTARSGPKTPISSAAAWPLGRRIGSSCTLKRPRPECCHDRAHTNDGPRVHRNRPQYTEA